MKQLILQRVWSGLRCLHFQIRTFPGRFISFFLRSPVQSTGLSVKRGTFVSLPESKYLFTFLLMRVASVPFSKNWAYLLLVTEVQLVTLWYYHEVIVQFKCLTKKDNFLCVSIQVSKNNCLRYTEIKKCSLWCNCATLCALLILMCVFAQMLDSRVFS